MSIDLTLYIPINKYPLDKKLGVWLCHNKIDLDRDSDLFDIIIDNKNVEPVKMIECYSAPDEICDQITYGNVTKDAYDDPLTLIRAKDLAIILNNYNSECDITKAATAFITNLPNDYPIILYWN